MHQKRTERGDLDPQETSEWLQALDQVVEEAGPDRASFLLERLAQRARTVGVELPIQHNTPYINTIPPEEEVPYPGDRALERRIKNLARWNAMAAYTAQLTMGKSPAAAQAFLATLFSHVSVQDSSARASMQTFVGGKGDVLLAYENEAIQAKRTGAAVATIIPDDTLLIENPVAPIVSSPNQKTADAFIDFLYTDRAQIIFGTYGYRPVSESAAKVFDFPRIKHLSKISDLGGWAAVNSKFFDPQNGGSAMRATIRARVSAPRAVSRTIRTRRSCGHAVRWTSPRPSSRSTIPVTLEASHPSRSTSRRMGAPAPGSTSRSTWHCGSESSNSEASSGSRVRCRISRSKSSSHASQARDDRGMSRTHS